MEAVKSVWAPAASLSSSGDFAMVDLTPFPGRRPRDQSTQI